MTDQIDVTDWEHPFKVESAYEGIERRVLSFTDEMMLVHYTVEEGAEFPAHDHDVTQQAVFVIDGEVELFGDRSERLRTGDTFVVGPGVKHGIRGIAPTSRLIDAFAPPIEAYAESQD